MKIIRRLVILILLPLIAAGGFVAGALTADENFFTDSSACEAPSGNLPKGVPPVLNSVFTRAAKEYNTTPYAVALAYFVENRGYREPPPPYGKGAAWRTSPKGAGGGFQFMPATWHMYRNSNPANKRGDINDLVDSAYAAAHLLADLGAKGDASIGSLPKPSRGTVLWALGAYNAGPRGDFSNAETAQYLQLALAEYNRLFSKYSPQPAAAEANALTISAGDDCVPVPTSGDVQALIGKAREFAWVKGEDPEAGTGAQNGAYKKAVALAIRKGWHVGGEWVAGNDCQGFINILMRMSGYEPNWPNQTTAGLADAIARLPGWQKVGVQRGSFSIANLRPGDILVTPSKGHILLFIGKVSWTNSLFIEAANPRRGPYTNGTPPSLYSDGYVVLRKTGASM